jgi:thiamine biosynthesis lipoprotein
MPSVLTKFLFFSFCFFLLSCKESKTNDKLIEWSGQAMGSTFKISYKDSLSRNLSKEVDSLLLIFDKELSTYREDSRIVKLNQSDSCIFVSNQEPAFLIDLLEKSIQIHKMSQGYFNPTLMPLIEYWGFGSKNKEMVKEPNQKTIDSLLQFCKMNEISVNESENGKLICKKDKKIQLVFNAIAPGYAADLIGLFLEKKGIQNYMVEMGGEIRCRGKQNKKYGWIIGINTPREGVEKDDIQVITELNEMSLATSGNYRNFKTDGKLKYAHTLNPFTGFPEKNELLSVSIFTKECAIADAIATACMAMGKEKAWKLIQEQQIEAYLIYSDSEGNMQTIMTEKLKKWIKE